MKATRKTIGIAAPNEDAKVSQMSMVAQEFAAQPHIAVGGIEQTVSTFGGPVGESIYRLEAQLSGDVALPAFPLHGVATAVETLSRWTGVMAFAGALGGLFYLFA